MNHEAAREALSRIYTAEHQVLVELVKGMGFKASHITAHLQGRELTTEQAVIQGLEFALSCLDGAEEEAAHGYRPTPLPGQDPEPIISASEADIVLTQVHGLTHAELFELARILGMMFSMVMGEHGLTEGEVYRRGVQVIGTQIENARENAREVQG